MGKLIFNVEDFNDVYMDLLDVTDDAPDINMLITSVVDDINNMLEITDEYVNGSPDAIRKVKLTGLNYIVGLVHDSDNTMVVTKRVLKPLRGVYELVINNIDGIDTWPFYRYEVSEVRIAGRSHDILHVDLKTVEMYVDAGEMLCNAYIRVFSGVFNSLWGSERLRI